MLLLQLLVDGLVGGCGVAMVAMTFGYVYATSGVFHVAHAGIYTLGAYAAWFAAEKGVPFLPALVIGVLAGAAGGALIQVALYDRLASRKASPLVVLIASLGALAIVQNLIAMVFTSNIQQFTNSWRLLTVSLGPVTLSYPQLALVAAGLASYLGLEAFSRYTQLGKRIRAVASNPQLAEISRLAPRAVYVYVMAIASAVVALSGILTGVDQALQPYNSVLVLLTAVVAVIAGGIGSLSGAFIMGVALTVLQSVALVFIPGRWSIAAVFLVFIAFILLRPEGLFRGKFSRPV
jgi:branched-chain amino acid transport system permease protein